MIILTNPKQVNSILGNSAALVAYDRIVLSPLTFDPKSLIISAVIRVTSVASSDMQEILGKLDINTSTGKLLIEIPTLDFYRRLTLSGGQITTVNGWINTTQNTIEAGLITVAVMAGVQSTGS